VSGGRRDAVSLLFPFPFSDFFSSRITPVDLGLGFFKIFSPILFVPDLRTSLQDLLLPHLDQQPRPL
jgi:hypothetical protein